jgi:hypothetical protein
MSGNLRSYGYSEFIQDADQRAHMNIRSQTSVDDSRLLNHLTDKFELLEVRPDRDDSFTLTPNPWFRKFKNSVNESNRALRSANLSVTFGALGTLSRVSSTALSLTGVIKII